MKDIILTNIFHILFVILITFKLLGYSLSWLCVFLPIIIELAMVIGYAACEYNQKKGNK